MDNIIKRRRSFWMVKITLQFLNLFLCIIAAATIVSNFIIIKILSQIQNQLDLGIKFIILQIGFGVVVLISLAAIFLLAYRTIGPLPRMANILDKVLEGDYSKRIHLRDKDVLSGFVDKINAIIDLLENKDKASKG